MHPAGLPDATRRQLLELARRAARKAYCPYSGFHVGAAVMASDGRLFVGSNVENASYGLTICAERSAIFTASSAGAHRLRAGPEVVIEGGGNGRKIRAELPADAVVPDVNFMHRANRTGLDQFDGPAVAVADRVILHTSLRH